ncbi:hypothetical protein [Klebsiella aerogenes]|uniref:hypothetical protein n=1 Tax=Klebsiella aerogenes TaxID=548 RepID=UPI0013C2AD0A|nr:hypothetical protein [Klebsiella aerogenes]HBR6858853.1 hypothetical protein [Klebsiella aerogenes]
MTTVTKLTGVVLPGTGYPNINSFKEIYVSVTSGLLGLYSFRNSLDFSRKNYAENGVDLTIIGAPTLVDGGAVCNYENCFDTGISAQDSFTYIALSKPTLATSAEQYCMLISNYFQPTPTTNAGDSIGFAWNGSAPRFRCYAQNSPSSVVQADAGVAGFSESEVALFAGMASLTDGNRLAFAHAGTLSIGNPTAMSARSTSGAGTILIGGHRAGSGAYPAFGKGIYAAAIYNSAVTNEELGVIYNDLKIYAEGRGITTL